MSYQVLARKWRPRTFESLVGQEHVVQALVNGLDQGRLHHAFLFTGTRGVGKTTIARILAKCLNCETGVTSKPCGECGSCVDIDDGRFIDMLEIDAASRTKVDDTRELLDSVQFMPTRGRHKVYIIDEVHMLSTSSFNALLKTLEEPPEHVKFVLATTDPQKIPVTILSRCLQFNLRRLLPEQIGGYLNCILEAENIEAEPLAVERLSRSADGSMRDGLSLMDQAISYGGGQLRDADVAAMLGSIDHAHVASLVSAIADGDATSVLATVAELAAQSRDLAVVLGDLAELTHRIALVQCAPGYRDPERTDWESIEELAELISPEDAQLFYQIAIQGRHDLGIAPDPRTGLEMTLLRMIAFRPAAPGGGGPSEATPKPTRSPVSAKPASTAATRPQANTAPTSSAGNHVADKPAAAETIGKSRSTAAPGTQASLPVQPAEQLTKPASEQSSENDWEHLAGRLSLTGPTRELARNITLQSADEHHWRFQIPDNLAHLSSDKLLNRLGEALSSELGHEVSLSLHAASVPLSTPAAKADHAQRQSMSDAERAIEEDPTVRELKEQFGAVVERDSIQPLQ